ncbi:MAG: HEAT repeat domain-containing protein [Treponema sp.]|nr:HEAT repeat domain-containing protein [Treponema sp.]
MKKILFPVLCFFMIAPALPAQTDALAADAKGALEAENEQRFRVIRYGTDIEIAGLIRALRSEQIEEESPLDDELRALAEKTNNRAILSGVFGYFGERKKTGLEERAKKAVADRDYEETQTVTGAIDYLGLVKARDCTGIFEDILKGEETRYLASAIRAMGRCSAENADSDSTAAFLSSYYQDRESSDENRREIILALGETRSKNAAAFLADIAENEEEKAPLRMASLESIAKIGDESGLGAALKTVSSKDPNVRSAAIGALSPFDGQAVDDAIVEAFRDSYYRSRIAAAKAAAMRKITGAVPFLVFRAENDEVPSVKEEAIKALGRIGNDEARDALEKLFGEKKNSDRVRIAAAEMLLAQNGGYTQRIVQALDEAKTANQTALYNGILKSLGTAKLDNLQDFARRLFAGGGVIEKSYAIDICSNNNYRELASELQKLSDPKNGSLSRKSTALLEKWGLPLSPPENENEAEAETAPSS